MSVEERAEPDPAPGEALLAVVATGICGSDVHGYTGENGRRHPGQVMGHETVGRVAALGPGTDGPARGSVVTVNPVISDGTCAACRSGNGHLCESRRVIGVDPTYSSAFADFFVAPVANLVPLPPGIPTELGSLVEPLAVGYHAARRGGVNPDSSVAVIGGGPIGQAAALAARRLGCTQVLVSEVDPGRRRLVEALGFYAVDPRDGGLGRAVRDRFGRPATVVLDAVGVDASVADAVAGSGLGATIVLLGMGSPDLQLKAYAISTEERSLVGTFTYTADDFRSTADWVGRNSDGLARLIDRRVGLDEAPAAFRDLASGDLKASKVIVVLAE
jgi:threonine dehydrogenase-like Zn-dependent dehydrogenase